MRVVEEISGGRIVVFSQERAEFPDADRREGKALKDRFGDLA